MYVCSLNDITLTPSFLSNICMKICVFPGMKIINDNVFGPIVLSPVNWLFIDTRAFQRLRNLLQLGMTPWVYPTGCHKRFEHSIGTAFLAGKLVANIQQSQPELDINEQDLMCAELAGLLHDIGKINTTYFFSCCTAPLILFFVVILYCRTWSLLSLLGCRCSSCSWNQVSCELLPVSF